METWERGTDSSGFPGEKLVGAGVDVVVTTRSQCPTVIGPGWSLDQSQPGHQKSGGCPPEERQSAPLLAEGGDVGHGILEVGACGGGVISESEDELGFLDIRDDVESEGGALGDATVDVFVGRDVGREADLLCSPSEDGGDPVENTFLDADAMESGDEGVVGYSVEGHREVEEDEGCCSTEVWEVPDVISCCDQGGLSAVVWSEARLGWVEEVVVFEVVCVVFSSGENWKQQRRLSLMILRNLGLGKKSLEGQIAEVAQNLVESFASNKGIALDPEPILVQSVANVTSAVVFGHHFSKDDKGFHQFIEGSNTTARFLGSVWARLFEAFPRLMELLPGPHQTVFRLNDFASRFVKEEIESHWEKIIPEDPQDFIDFYLNQLVKGSDDATTTFDQDNLIRLAIELFGAGIETTTSTLCWALLYMMTQPDIQEKVQKELDAVLDESHVIQYEDRKRLPYTNAVIHEIQRYCNIQGMGIFRQVVKDVSLLGYTIGKGTIVIPNLPSAMCDPECWKTPHQFNPANFLDKEGHFVTNEAFLPFSAGHRMCLGERLARTEIFIFFTSLLRAFTFRIPEGVMDINMGYMPGAILKPHPYKICAIPH
ncbi:cytochrome P450 2J5-like [Pleurodeles waltl]|uniref:cytochrome P450 2J5-like n=1 Tax=Pleurodeles waltl TaxID=8319 RepID=UPI003709551B